MKKITLHIIITVFFFAGNFLNRAYAQLSFCSGNSGDPIYSETFGTGTSNGPALPPGTTSYTYANTQPDDGFYTISSNTNWFDWHDTQDHTPGDVNGRCLIVNADFTAGEFYRTTIEGLCGGTTYEFSSWLLNLLPPGGFCGTGIPINVKFQIWDSTDTVLLASGDTGDIQGTTTPVWEEYGLVFTTTSGQSSVILKMINNGIGGCGNDLAIDDIVFKTCGDTITVQNSDNNQNVSLCSDQIPYSTTLQAVPDFSVFNSHAYQWQQSEDGINWTDIPGETNQTYQVSGITTTTAFRVKVAESAVNLANNSCNTISEHFNISIVDPPDSPLSDGDVSFNCAANLAALSVSVPDGVTVNWYDALVNGNSLEVGSNTFVTNQSTGTFYAEAVDETTGCVAATRTPVTVFTAYPDAPISNGDVIIDCETGTAVAQVTVPAGVSVNWYDQSLNVLATDSPTYTATQPGVYFAESYSIETGCVSLTGTEVEVLGINPEPPVTNGDVEVGCATDSGTLSVSVPDGVIVNWYDAASEGNLLAANTASYTTNLEGIYYAEAVDENTGCKSLQRTAVELSAQDEYPEVEDEIRTLCENESITLDAGIANLSYLWNTGETTQQILTNQPGTYTVVVSSAANCSATKTIQVIQSESPVIQSIDSEGFQLIIETTETGNYQYSIDGTQFQTSNVFYVEGGAYTIYVQGPDGCGLTTAEYIHFVIPKFFTPNNDGFNDRFKLGGIEQYNSSVVHIFDRYGKLLYQTKNQPFSWDGTFNNKQLPADDYWYYIEIENQVFQGHFTLKR